MAKCRHTVSQWHSPRIASNECCLSGVLTVWSREQIHCVQLLWRNELMSSSSDTLYLCCAFLSWMLTLQIKLVSIWNRSWNLLIALFFKDYNQINGCAIDLIIMQLSGSENSIKGQFPGTFWSTLLLSGKIFHLTETLFQDIKRWTSLLLAGFAKDFMDIHTLQRLNCFYVSYTTLRLKS